MFLLWAGTPWYLPQGLSIVEKLHFRFLCYSRVPFMFLTLQQIDPHCHIYVRIVGTIYSEKIPERRKEVVENGEAWPSNKFSYAFVYSPRRCQRRRRRLRQTTNTRKRVDPVSHCGRDPQPPEKFALQAFSRSTMYLTRSSHSSQNSSTHTTKLFPRDFYTHS